MACHKMLHPLDMLVWKPQLGKWELALPLEEVTTSTGSPEHQTPQQWWAAKQKWRPAFCTKHLPVLLYDNCSICLYRMTLSTLHHSTAAKRWRQYYGIQGNDKSTKLPLQKLSAIASTCNKDTLSTAIDAIHTAGRGCTTVCCATAV